MIREIGKLAVGVEYDGVMQQEFSLGPQLVKHTFEVMREEGEKADDALYMGVCLLAKQIVKLGTIPKEEITRETLMNMTAVDFNILCEARDALEVRQKSFCEEPKKPEKSNPDNAKTGV